jgi:murein DD-endopeptidase MepM/ murein hydrolase activator NlpD
MSTATDLTEILLRHQPYFNVVVPYDASTDKLLELDFTAANQDLTDSMLEDTVKFTAYIEQRIADAGARYGIGGYAEHRTVYRVSRVFAGATAEEEPRRLHLGTDIWAPANTPVMAPLDGHIHSFAFNDQFGDYGATIILSHTLEGITFHTLYGHLSLESIATIRAGASVKKGETFAWYGIPEHNGHWPPHLHFQVICDMENKKGDYPGVCKLSEKEKYLANCPDPNLILQMAPAYH